MHDIVHLAERMIERQRLDVEHVEAGAGDRLVLSAAISAFSSTIGPREVLIEVGRLLHQAEFLGADQAARAVAQHDMDGDEVGVAEQVLLGRRIRRRPPCAFSAVRFWLQAMAFMPKALPTAADALAELAEAEDAERQAFEIAGRS